VGTPGVGKSSLAVHWAHRIRDRFPAGRIEQPQLRSTLHQDHILRHFDSEVIGTSTLRHHHLRFQPAHRLDRRLAGEQFSEHRGGALARIFLDELFNEQKGFCFATCRNVTPGLDPGVHRF
jgi:DNA replication protein DnaC